MSNRQKTGRWIMRTAGRDWCGSPDTPARDVSLRIPYDEDPSEYRVYTTNNDDFELWIGYQDQWRWHMSRKEALRLAWFIVWTWRIKAEWFGLRRWAYYRGLHMAVGRERSRR